MMFIKAYKPVFKYINEVQLDGLHKATVGKRTGHFYHPQTGEASVGRTGFSPKTPKIKTNRTTEPLLETTSILPSETIKTLAP